MVFAPTRDIGVGEHEPAAAPRRPDHVAAPQGGRDRLHWRAVVHARGRDEVQTTWHLATCGNSLDAEAHCAEGKRLLEVMRDPDGHCLVDGHCARCEPSP